MRSEIVAAELRGDDLRRRIGLGVELRQQQIDERGLAGADLAGDDDEALALMQPVGQMRHGAGVAGAAEEEARIGRELERQSA